MMNIGDKVICKAGNIDRNNGRGAVGYVTGFATFSKYHAREAFVSNKHPDEGGNASAPWCGWFWVSDLEPSA